MTFNPKNYIGSVMAEARSAYKKSYYRKYIGHDFHEFVNICWLYWYKATKNFDPNRNVSFNTYCRQVMRYGMFETCKSQYVTKQANLTTLFRQQKNNKINPHLHINTKFRFIGNNKINVIMKPETTNLFDYQFNLEKLLNNTLTKKEKFVIIYYFGLFNYPELTLKEISKLFNPAVSHQRISQIYKNSMKKLKRHLYRLTKNTNIDDVVIQLS